MRHQKLLHYTYHKARIYSWNLVPIRLVAVQLYRPKSLSDVGAI